MQSSPSTSPPRNSPLRGVCSALLVPRNAEHEVDFEATERLLRFQQDRGIRAFALNGATGEYTRSSREEVAELLRFLRLQLQSDATLVLGVGGPDISQVQHLIDLGLKGGVDGYLVPIPYYFPLEQQDIIAFVDALRFEKPAYLYNLPTFTSAIGPETALALIKAKTHVVGVKDSSGSLDTVRLLSREAPEAARIIGNDSALHAAVAEKVCDGVVSGVAGVLPELMRELFAEASADAESARSQQLLGSLMEYIDWLNKLPVPWGLKLTAESRGLFKAEFSVPLSQQRYTTAVQFSEWLIRNREQLLIS